MRYDAGMGVELLTKRHKDQIVGVLSCYDRILIQGTVPGWCYARGMTDYFYKHQLRIFDYPKWAEPLRQQLRQNLERIAAENALEIEFVRSRKSCRKEDRVKQILEKRGEHSGGSVYSVGPGVVRQLQAVARQAKPPDVSQAGRWQVPSLLRLLPGRRSGALLPAGDGVVPGRRQCPSQAA